jgi:hypothetical protein
MVVRWSKVQGLWAQHRRLAKRRDGCREGLFVEDLRRSFYGT